MNRISQKKPFSSSGRGSRRQGASHSISNFSRGKGGEKKWKDSSNFSRTNQVNQAAKQTKRRPSPTQDRRAQREKPSSDLDIRELLFKSKPPAAKPDKSYLDDIEDEIDFDLEAEEKEKTDDADAEQVSETRDDPPEPVLLKVKSPWKKKILQEESLLHLLVLEILYARMISPEIKGAHLFEWLRENHSFFLSQDIPSALAGQVEIWVDAIESQRSEIIEELTPLLVDWNWDRLPPLRQIILVTGWYLIKTSGKVSERLNDAINHAKWFGDDKDYAFVNSILDKLISQHGLWESHD